MSGGGEIMAGCVWPWVVAANLCLVMSGRGWWQQNYGCLWVVVVGRTIW